MEPYKVALIWSGSPKLQVLEIHLRYTRIGHGSYTIDLLGMEKVMNKYLWAHGQYQSDTKIEEKVKVVSQGMARQAD